MHFYNFGFEIITFCHIYVLFLHLFAVFLITKLASSHILSGCVWRWQVGRVGFLVQETHPTLLSCMLLVWFHETAEPQQCHQASVELHSHMSTHFCAYQKGPTLTSWRVGFILPPSSPPLIPWGTLLSKRHHNIHSPKLECKSGPQHLSLPALPHTGGNLRFCVSLLIPLPCSFAVLLAQQKTPLSLGMHIHLYPTLP